MVFIPGIRSGSNGIYPRLISEAGVESGGACTNSNVAMGPEDCTEANVVPLFHTPGDYRPVSLTSVIGRVLERSLWAN